MGILITPKGRQMGGINEVETSIGRGAWVATLLLPGAGLAWGAAMLTSNVGAINDYGLLPVLSPWYYLSLVLLVASFVLVLAWRPASSLLLSAHLAMLVVILHGTQAVLFADPWYAWTYKHIGVVQYISTHGSVNSSIDIYQNWPGFFSLSALFDQVAGVSTPAVYAAWAPVYFELLFLVAIAFAIRPLTPSPQLRWTALFLFEATNWVGSGSDYFSPQALAFVLAMVVMGILLNHFRSDRPIWLAKIEAQAARLVGGASALADPASHPPLAGWWRRFLQAAIVVMFGMLVITHQLTPYLVLFGVVPMALVGMIRPRWIAVVLAAMTLAFLYTRLGFVNAHFSLLGSFNPFQNAQYSAVGGEQGTAGRLFGAHVTRALSVAVWVLAGVGAIVNVRRGISAALPVALAVASALVFFGQDYGGEAIFRVFLFSLPWIAVLGASCVAPGGRWAYWQSVQAGAIFIVGLALFIPSYFGLAAVYAVPAADLVASQYLYDHAPGGSYLVLAAPNFPVRIAGTYDRVLGEFPDADYAALTANSAFQTDQSTEQDVERISQYTYSRTNHGKNSAYLVLGPSEDAYLAEYDGTTSAMAKLDNALGKSPKWRVFYRNGGTVIYQVLSA